MVQIAAIGRHQVRNGQVRYDVTVRSPPATTLPKRSSNSARAGSQSETALVDDDQRKYIDAIRAEAPFT